jgi:hypothetical protein
MKRLWIMTLWLGLALISSGGAMASETWHYVGQSGDGIKLYCSRDEMEKGPEGRLRVWEKLVAPSGETRQLRVEIDCRSGQYRLLEYRSTEDARPQPMERAADQWRFSIPESLREQEMRMLCPSR